MYIFVFLSEKVRINVYINCKEMLLVYIYWCCLFVK